MNAVGIDVSKGKSMVAIMRPFGEIVSAPFEIKHTASDINSLVKLINSVEGESRIVMEHTGRYYEVLAHQLSEANLFVSAINPKLIKDFDNDSLRKIKSDKADAVKIARYALDKWQNLKQYSVMDELRNQLKTMNRQFGFYMKHKTAMKNNLIASLTKPILVLILTLTVLHAITAARNGLILHLHTGTWTASVKCPKTHLLTITRTGANARSTISANPKLKKSMEKQRSLFLYFLRMTLQRLSSNKLLISLIVSLQPSSHYALL